MIIWVAKRCYPGCEIPEDAIAEGRLGLVIAARSYDPKHESKASFSTFAQYQIRARILQYIIENRFPTRFGTRRADRTIFFGLNKARARAGEGASNAAIAAELKVSVKDLEIALPRMQASDLELDSDDTHTELRGGENFEEALGEHQEKTLAHEELEQSLRVLDKRERLIIRGRYMRAKPLTLQQLGEKFGISRERIRQIEIRALAKLRKEML